MFSAGLTPGSLDRDSVLQSQVAQARQELHELLRTGTADPATIQQVEARIAEAIESHRFEIIQQLPHFIKQVVQSLTAAKIYHEFRLPGRDRVIRDLRETPKGEDKKTAEKKAEAKEEGQEKTAEEKRAINREAESMALREGRLVKQKARVYENYLGDRSRLGVSPEQRAATDRFERLLSAFEQLIVARFEGGAEVARPSPDGRPHFLPKTEAQWREFFASFLERTVGKRVLLSDIQEFLFRGIVPKGGKGVVISDVTFTNGSVEKFIRFSVLADALSKLKTLVPGQAFQASDLSGFSSEELVYLALAVARGRALATSEAPTQGKFMGGAAEARAASELGIQLENQLQAKTKLFRKRGGKGMLGWSGGEIPEDNAGQFVPWWMWGNLERPGKKRWITIVFYLSLLAISVIGVGVLTSRLLF